jgi:hypothetical protein
MCFLVLRACRVKEGDVLFGNFHLSELCVPVYLRDRVLRGLLRRRVSARGGRKAGGGCTMEMRRRGQV